MQAREARLYSTPTHTLLTCTSGNTSAPGALVLCPGPATPATSFVRSAAALPEAHAHTLHPGSRGRPDTAPRNLDHLGTRDQPRDPRPPASPSPARRAVGLGVPALRSPPSPTVPRSGRLAEGRERDRAALTGKSAARPARRCSGPAASFPAPHPGPREPRRKVAGRRLCRQPGPAARPSPWLGAAGGGW